MTMIPIDMDQVPTSPDPLDESVSYRVVLRKVVQAPKLDKNGEKYYQVDTEVISPPEYKGRHVGDNYIKSPELTGKSPRFAQFIKCFAVPYTKTGVNPEDGIGREGNVMIKNEEYQGEMRSKINVYLAP
jgi:hypothetical protein